MNASVIYVKIKNIYLPFYYELEPEYFIDMIILTLMDEYGDILYDEGNNVIIGDM